MLTVTSDLTITVLEDQGDDWPTIVHTTELSQRTAPHTSSAPEFSEKHIVTSPILAQHSKSEASDGSEQLDSIVYMAFVSSEFVFVLDLRIQVRPQPVHTFAIADMRLQASDTCLMPGPG